MNVASQFSWPPPITRDAPSSSIASTRAHVRLAVTNAATGVTLASLCSGSVVPRYQSGTGMAPEYPIAVELVVEKASSALDVWISKDGGDVSATLGIQLPTAPNPPMRIDFVGGDSTVNIGTIIKLIASAAGPAYVQAHFYWGT